MGKQVAAGFEFNSHLTFIYIVHVHVVKWHETEWLNRGLQLSWLERTPDKREVGGSSPLKPTQINVKQPQGFHIYKVTAKGGDHLRNQVH